jgi:signal peptidase I
MTAPTPAPASEQLPIPAPAGEEIKPSNVGRNALEWVGIIVAALLAAFLIKTFLLQAFYIPSESMDPTLKIGDRVLVNKLSYKMHAVHRGDIVVFKRPPAEQGGDPTIKDLIKRIVGMPGETVQGKQGHIWITPATGGDAHELNEPYLPAGITTFDFPAQKIPANAYWVMGDNRPRSKDSRYFGAIGKNLLVGRAFIRVWPITSIHLL